MDIGDNVLIKMRLRSDDDTSLLVYDGFRGVIVDMDVIVSTNTPLYGVSTVKGLCWCYEDEIMAVN